MGKRSGCSMAELCGVGIGAGFASGKELAAFFARFGPWSWLGVAAAVAVLGGACYRLMCRPGLAGMPTSWQGRWLARLWQGMFAALMITTGGAMLAAGGELAGLLVPFHGAHALGLGVTLLMAWTLARHESAALARVSRALIAAMMAVLAAGAFLPPKAAASLEQASSWQCLPMGVCYGGFNAALAAPLMASTGKSLQPHQRLRCAGLFTVITGLLLACGNGVLLRHDGLIHQELPFVYLLAGLGQTGYALGAVVLYLAALTTLSACMKSLRTLLGPWAWAGGGAVAVLSLGGMGAIVSIVYPILGGGCALLLVLALGQKS